MSDEMTGAAPAAPASAPAPETAAIAPAQTAEVQSPIDALENTMGAIYDKMNPPREAGKFAPKDIKAEGAETGEPAKADAPTTDQPQAEAVKPETPAIEPPVSWSADMKAKFAALPPDAQQYIAQRESEAHKRISQFGEQVKAVEPLARVAQQHNDYFRQKGATPDQWLANMVEMSRAFDANPVQVLNYLARERGLAPMQPGQQNDYVRSLEARVRRAEEAANSAKTAVTQREQTEHEQRLASIVSKIENFAKDKPDYANLQDDMLAHVEAIRRAEPDIDAEKLLAKAYEAARWANPNTRTKILEETRKAEDAKREAEQKKKADEARKLGSLNVKSANGANPSRKGSWEDTLRAVGERLA